MNHRSLLAGTCLLSAFFVACIDIAVPSNADDLDGNRTIDLTSAGGDAGGDPGDGEERRTTETGTDGGHAATKPEPTKPATTPVMGDAQAPDAAPTKPTAMPSPTCAIPELGTPSEVTIAITPAARTNNDPTGVAAIGPSTVIVKHPTIGLTHIVLTTCDASGATTYSKPVVARDHAPFEWHFKGVVLKEGVTQLAIKADPNAKILGTMTTP